MSTFTATCNGWTEAAFIAECKRLFNAARYGWSGWEQGKAESGWLNEQAPEAVVIRMNYAHQCRKADRMSGV